jgi:hypothetical protein
VPSRTEVGVGMRHAAAVSATSTSTLSSSAVRRASISLITFLSSSRSWDFSEPMLWRSIGRDTFDALGDYADHTSTAARQSETKKPATKEIYSSKPVSPSGLPELCLHTWVQSKILEGDARLLRSICWRQHLATKFRALLDSEGVSCKATCNAHVLVTSITPQQDMSAGCTRTLSRSSVA